MEQACRLLDLVVEGGFTGIFLKIISNFIQVINDLALVGVCIVSAIQWLPSYVLLFSRCVRDAFGAPRGPIDPACRLPRVGAIDMTVEMYVIGVQRRNSKIGLVAFIKLVSGGVAAVAAFFSSYK